MRKAPRVALLLQATRGFDRGLLTGIVRYAVLHGSWTFYRPPHSYLRAQWRFAPKDLEAWKPDGAFCPVNQLDKFTPLGVPLVAYDVSEYSGPVPAVLSDDAKAGKLAAEHFLKLGHRHFAFCGYGSIGWSRRRCEVFRTAVEEAGFRIEVYRPGGRAQIPWPKEEPALREWLHSLPKPLGLLCANDDRAESVFEICRGLGLGIPEDVSVLGVDNDQYVCQMQNPPLSSITMASDRAGYEAAALLERMMRGDESMAGQRILAPATGVVERQSTSVLMVGDPHVRSALRFIRENATWATQVSDVVRAGELSHRALNERFQAELGCSIKTQLAGARVAYISRLLIETTTPIQEIAQMAGYEHDRHLSRYFKRSTGLTPAAFRRKYTLP